MAFNFAEKTVFSGATPFSGVQKTAIINAMQTAYNGSATARAMFDNWGKTISIANVPGVFQAYTDGTGRVEIDLPYINDLSYINDKGKPVLHSLVGALVHELGHALTLRRDNISLTDYQGDNVRYVNTIWKELGLDKEISYRAQARSNIHKVGYEYTNGAPIDAARSGNTDWSSAALGTSKDLLIGGASANVLQSGGGNDFLFGGGGDDDLRGDAGRDTAVYFGSALDYDIRQNTDGSWAVRNVRGAKDAGSDTLKNIEAVQFDGGKTYELKKKGLTFQTDFALVIDTTGSMGSSINSVKTQASALINAVFASGDGRIGVVGFKDTTNGEPSSVILPFTDQDDFAARKSAAITAINSIGVGGGGDLPETAFDGLRLALNGSMGKWRPGSGVHRIALFTDAEAKDGALAAEVTALATSIGATISKKSSIASLGGSVDTFNLAFAGGTSKTTAGLFGPDDPSADPDVPVVLTDEPIDPDSTTAQVQIFTILTGGSGADTTALSAIAKANGGDLLTATDNDELVKKLLEIISAPPLATVSITANDPDAGETTNPGQFTLNRTGILTNPLTVSYTLSGTANSADYQPLSGTVVFAAGSSTANIAVNVVDDSVYEGNETVIVTLATGGTNYQVDSSAQSATVTITDNETNSGPLNLVGTPLPDMLTGKSGNDTISGLADNDTLSGADGNDTIKGGTGNDIVNGDNGYDDLYGDAGNDTVIGGGGNDNIYGGDGDDSVVGGLGRDYVIGDAGNDTVEGGYGNDYVYGGAGNDRVLGGSDDDYLDGGIGNDYVDGENGADFVIGGYGSDTVVGGLGNDTVDGGAGADLDNLFGGAGVDTFVLSKRASDNINDFAVGEFLQVSASAFGGGLVAGAALQSAQLLVGAGFTTAATRFIYNSGELFFDADGSGLGVAAVKVATLAGNPSLATSNFSIVR